MWVKKTSLMEDEKMPQLKEEIERYLEYYLYHDVRELIIQLIKDPELKNKLLLVLKGNFGRKLRNLCYHVLMKFPEAYLNEQMKNQIIKIYME